MKIGASILFLFSIPALAEGPVLTAKPQASPVQPKRVLTLEEVIDTTRTNQWQLKQARENTVAAYAQADIARAPLLPQLTGVSYTYERTTANLQPHPGYTIFQTQPFSFKSYNYLNFNGSLSQLVWDFGFTSQAWHSAQAHANSQLETERYTALQVLLTVRTAYFTVRANKELVEVAQKTLTDQNTHLRQTKGFVEVGTQPEIAEATALANVANAEVQLITAENNYDTAKAQLNQAMGVEGPIDFEVADESLPPVPGEDQSTEDMLPRALRNRQDLSSLKQQIQSQELSVKSFEGSYWPNLNVSFNWANIGTALDNAQWNGNVNATINWNIYQGGLTDAQLHQAHATLYAFEAQAEGLRQQMRLDVEQARLALRAARTSLDSAERALTNSQEQLRLAEGRFQVGLGSIIELSDAQVAASSAAAQRVQANFNVAIARAQLLRALGDLGPFAKVGGS